MTQKRKGESTDSLMRRFKSDIKKDGVLKKYREKSEYKKPSEIRKERRETARKRTQAQQQLVVR